MGRTLEQSDSEKRTSARANVLFLATLRCGGFDFPVQLRNLSEGGALILSGELPYGTMPIHLERNGTTVRGRLVWSRQGKAGLRFEDPVGVEAMLRRVPRPRRPYVARSQRSPIGDSRPRRWESANMEYWSHLYMGRGTSF